MKGKKELYVVISSIFILAFAVFVSADTAYHQVACSDCQIYFGELGYCSNNVCYVADNPPAQAVEQPIVDPQAGQLGVQQTAPQLVQTGAQFVATPEVTTTEFNVLKQRVETLETSLNTVSQKLNTIETGISSVQNSVNQLAQVSQSVQSQQQQVTSLQQEVNGIATGLAGLQVEVESTKENLNTIEERVDSTKSSSKALGYGLLILLVAGIGGGVFYFLNKRDSGIEVNDEILMYITKHIKAGKKFPEIKKNLLKAGWSSKDIESAYKVTMKKNYEKYSKKKKKHTSFTGDRNKMVFLAAFSILIIVGSLFILRGVTVGNAIAVRYPNQASFALAVENRLTYVSTANPYSTHIQMGSFCVEVHDGNKTVSFNVTKQGGSRTIEEVPVDCKDNPSYDASVMFATWRGFDLTTADMSCSNIANKHLEHFVVLPSKYVLPGFIKNPVRDYSPFCSALAVCLSPAELGQLGCPIQTVSS